MVIPTEMNNVHITNTSKSSSLSINSHYSFETTHSVLTKTTTNATLCDKITSAFYHEQKEKSTILQINEHNTH